MTRRKICAPKAKVLILTSLFRHIEFKPHWYNLHVYNLDLRGTWIIKSARCLPRKKHHFVCLALRGLWQCTNAYASRIHCLPRKLPPFQLLPNWRIISPAPCVMASLQKQWPPRVYTAFVRNASLSGGPKRVSPKGALSVTKSVPQSATFAQILLLTPLSSCSSQMGNVRMMIWKWYFAGFTYATISNNMLFQIESCKPRWSDD